MALSVSIGGTTFMLTISSDGSPASLVSVEQDQHNAAYDNDPDTKVQLRNFSGTLLISHNDSKQEPRMHENLESDTEQRCKQSLGSDAAQIDENRRLPLQPIKQQGDKNQTSYGRTSKSYDDDIRNYEVSFSADAQSRKISNRYSNYSTMFDYWSESEDEKDISDEDEENRPLKDILKSVVKKKTKSMRQTTRLHVVCQSPKVKMKNLLATLEDAPSYATCRDSSGMLPLHIIAQNEGFIFGHKERNVNLFIEHLICAYPDALSTIDDNGRVPFTTAIFNWIQDTYKPDNVEVVKASNIRKSIITECLLELELPLSVVVTPVVRWSFSMLCWILENAALENSISTSDTNFMCLIKSNSEEILDNIVSLPNLLPTILLIDDAMYREQLVNFPIIQRILLRKQNVDKWLVVMLASGGDRAARAVDYLEMLSNLTPYKAFGIHWKLHPCEKQYFIQLQKEIIRHIAHLNWILPSLLCLDEKNRWRACKTHAVKQILDLATVNPSLIGLIFLDFALHASLLIAYHAQMILAGNLDSLPNKARFAPSMLVIWICIYFLLRDDYFESLMVKSWRKFFTRYFHFGNFIELTSVGFAFATTLSTFIRVSASNSTVIAVTIGLIWMRLLVFMKRINLPLALFILSLTNIVKEIKWLMIVLCISCAMFAQMIYVVYTTGSREMCAGVDPALDHGITGDYCSQSFIRSFLRGYSIIVGDITLDDYRDSPFITIIWTIFTIVGVIILLNVLIAIVNTSYETSLSQRHVLFGKARIPLLAKHYFLETQLIPLLWRSNSSVTCIKRYTIILFFVVFFCLMEASFISFIVYVATFPDDLFPRANMIWHLFLILILMAVANLSLIQVIMIFSGWKFDESKFGYFMNAHVISPVSNFLYSLLGIKGQDHEYEEIQVAEMDEIGITERIFHKIKELLERSETRIKMELHRLEGRRSRRTR